MIPQKIFTRTILKSQKLDGGTVVLIPFRFTELTNATVRPALLISTTKDKCRDIILCAISSMVPSVLGKFELPIQPDNLNKLRVPSVLKIDRIATLKQDDVVAVLGTLTDTQITAFKAKFRQIVD